MQIQPTPLREPSIPLLLTLLAGAAVACAAQDSVPPAPPETAAAPVPPPGHGRPGRRHAPEPFVLQTALGDHAVAYELNPYTSRPNRMAAIYSELHQNIQDRFNDAGIEIMSPAYTAIRDGNRVAIPEEHLPEGYRAPGFRIRRDGAGDGRAGP